MASILHRLRGSVAAAMRPSTPWMTLLSVPTSTCCTVSGATAGATCSEARGRRAGAQVWATHTSGPGHTPLKSWPGTAQALHTTQVLATHRWAAVSVVGAATEGAPKYTGGGAVACECSGSAARPGHCLLAA